MDLRETAGDVRRDFARRFDNAKVQRVDLIKPTRGGDNFASTLISTVTKTHDPDAVLAVGTCLRTIVELPQAGTVSWHMRAFIRQATSEEIIEYAALIKTLAAQAPELLVLTDIRNRGLVEHELNRLRSLVSISGQTSVAKAV